MTPVPNYPNVGYDVTQDQYGHVWIDFFCSACGDHSRKRCENAARAPYWASYYAKMHAHR